MSTAAQGLHATRRVVVTGIGLATPLGASLDETREALREGQRVAVTGSPPLARVPPLEIRRFFRQPKAVKLTDLKTGLAVACARMAADDAGLEPAAGEEVAVVVGCSASELQIEDLGAALDNADQARRAVDDIRFFGEQMQRHLNPLWLLISLPNMVSAHVSIQLGARGPNTTVMTDWVSGLQALGEAWAWVAEGRVQVALAGATESPGSPFDLGCYESEGLLGGAAPIPLAEGAAILVLEERDRARGRGARIYGEIAGYGTCSRRPGATPEGVHRALDAALATTGWERSSVARVVSSGLSRDPWRSWEASLVGALRGDGAEPETLAVADRLGHTLAASGAVAAALAFTLLGPGERGLCHAVGLLGQTAALAVEGREREASR